MKKRLKTKCQCGVLWDIDDRVGEEEAKRMACDGTPICTECCRPDDVELYIRKI